MRNFDFEDSLMDAAVIAHILFLLFAFTVIFAPLYHAAQIPVLTIEQVPATVIFPPE